MAKKSRDNTALSFSSNMGESGQHEGSQRPQELVAHNIFTFDDVAFPTSLNPPEPFSPPPLSSLSHSSFLKSARKNKHFNDFFFLFCLKHKRKKPHPFCNNTERHNRLHRTLVRIVRECQSSRTLQ